jgi:hypothetical protein
MSVTMIRRGHQIGDGTNDRNLKERRLITDRCPHQEDTPIGELCERCEEEGVGLIELAAEGEGVVTFLVPVSIGLGLEDLKALLPEEVWEAALVRRKLMTEELEEAVLEPYEEDPEAAEMEALDGELAWKLNMRMTYLIGHMWRRATLYVVPNPLCPSWAKALIASTPEEVRAALEGQTDT